MPNQKTIRAGVAAGGLAERVPLPIGYRLRPFVLRWHRCVASVWRSLGVVVREPFCDLFHVLLVIYLAPNRTGKGRHCDITQ